MASVIEDWGTIVPFVVVDAVVHVVSPSPGSSTATAALLLLLESASELLQKELILLNLGLKLTELFQVRASKLSEGKVLVPCYRGDNARRRRIARSLMKRSAVVHPLVFVARAWHPQSDVEALTSGIVSTFIVRIGVAKAIVACGQEAAHSFMVAEVGEIRSGPRLVHLRGVGVGVSRSHGTKVVGETLVVSQGLRMSGSVGISIGGGGVSQPEGVRMVPSPGSASLEPSSASPEPAP